MILILSVFTLLLTCILTFYNYQINKNVIYLSGLLVLLSLSGILHYFVIISDSVFGIAFFYTHFMPLLYLQGPLLFLYVMGTLKDEHSLNWKKTIHFIPSLLAFISILKYYFVPWSEKLKLAKAIITSPDILLSIDKYNFGNYFINVPARTLLLLVYSIATLYILIRYTNKNKIKNTLNTVIIKWLYFITIIVIICAMSYMLLIVQFMYFNIRTRVQISNELYNYITAFSYSLIPIVMLISPELLYGIPKVNRKKIELFKSGNNYLTKRIKVTIEKPFTKEENPEMNELANLILNYLITEKPFVDSKFSLDDLAKQLDVPKHHIYYCFKSILNTKFTTLRSQLRVEFAKELLISGQLEQLSMEGIWSKTGFSSRTNFFVTFKEITGLTPLEFVQINSVN
jgi:AraC-like DNA-binding protein